DYLESDRKYVLAAGQCLYGAWESQEGEGENIFGRFEEATNRYNIALLAADLDTLAADALGLRYVDYQVNKGQQYLYIISPNKDSLQIIPGGYTIRAEEVTYDTLKI